MRPRESSNIGMESTEPPGPLAPVPPCSQPSPPPPPPPPSPTVISKVSPTDRFSSSTTRVCPGNALPPVPAIRHGAIGTWRHHRSPRPPSATVTRVTPRADCPPDRLAVNQSTAVATVCAGCLISSLSNLHRGCVTAIPATRTVRVQTLNPERPPPRPPVAPVRIAKPRDVGHGQTNVPDATIRVSPQPRHADTPPAQALAQVTADLHRICQHPDHLAMAPLPKNGSLALYHADSRIPDRLHRYSFRGGDARAPEAPRRDGHWGRRDPPRRRLHQAPIQVRTA